MLLLLLLLILLLMMVVPGGQRCILLQQCFISSSRLMCGSGTEQWALTLFLSASLRLSYGNAHLVHE